MSNMTPLTKQMVRQFVEGFAPVHFPGKSVDEVLDTAKRMTGFSVDFVIEAAFTREQIQKELYWLTWSTPRKYQSVTMRMIRIQSGSFWRTAIHVTIC